MPVAARTWQTEARANAAHAPAYRPAPTPASVYTHLHHAILQLRILVQAAAATTPVQLQAAVHDRGLAASSQRHNGHLQDQAAAVRLQLTSSVMPETLEGQQKGLAEV